MRIRRILVSHNKKIEFGYLLQGLTELRFPMSRDKTTQLH